MAQKTCRACGVEFIQRSNRQVFCSNVCRRGTAKCRSCGVEFSPDRHSAKAFCSKKCWGASFVKAAKPDPKPRAGALSHRKRCPCCDVEFATRWSRQECCSKSCSMKKRNQLSDNPSWKGGRVKHSGGYEKLMAKDNPAADAGGYVMEHRLVMEGSIGRYLEPWERVHHKNGIRNDNRIENLELWFVRGKSRKDPSGQRASDLIDMVTSVADRYGLHPDGVRRMLRDTIFTGAR